MFRPTGVESIDRVLGDVVDLSGLVLPGRVEAIYAIGSVAEGKALWGRDRYDDFSDIDVCLILRGSLTQRDVDDCARLGARCNANGTVRLDLCGLGEDALVRTDDMTSTWSSSRPGRGKGRGRDARVGDRSVPKVSPESPLELAPS